MKRIGFFMFFIPFVFVTPVSAFTKICTVAKAALDMTSAQIQELYDDDLKGRRVEGEGLVYDVRTESVGRCTVVVDCGSDVLVYIKEENCRGSIKDLKMGQEIEFTGDCYGLGWQYYRDSDKKHIKTLVKNPLLNY